MARSDHSDRTVAERIARLRERIAKLATKHAKGDSPELLGVLQGILDLLGDEL